MLEAGITVGILALLGLAILAILLSGLEFGEIVLALGAGISAATFVVIVGLLTDATAPIILASAVGGFLGGAISYSATAASRSFIRR